MLGARTVRTLWGNYTRGSVGTWDTGNDPTSPSSTCNDFGFSDPKFATKKFRSSIVQIVRFVQLLGMRQHQWARFDKNHFPMTKTGI